MKLADCQVANQTLQAAATFDVGHLGPKWRIKFRRQVYRIH